MPLYRIQVLQRRKISVPKICKIRLKHPKLKHKFHGNKPLNFKAKSMTNLCYFLFLCLNQKCDTNVYLIEIRYLVIKENLMRKK